ncbi:hypothetical protein HGD80_02330 [Paulownia witches'-broom phytoplasma]|uniref:Effector n=1 Tax=Paulownia witches'-broom phytoplasma TaxID=39647 RepID=A0ABX8TS75_9MOLU|nr:hypothetical protein [Paulownia witches'-broom phytoplasma]QYC31426.1 hypothetical protein HGD80_02330 [Paulownia witches'-broom phytoplasma]GLH60848.1 hypothetical protein PAWBP_5860 [Paulownia witches'-broom phytoplasma]
MKKYNLFDNFICLLIGAIIGIFLYINFFITNNEESAKQLQQELLNKQTQINTINQKLFNLSNQQTSLQQELSDLIQTYDEWETTCEIKANQDINEDRIKDEAIYYSPCPFCS